jgi:hypothetical protein
MIPADWLHPSDGESLSPPLGGEHTIYCRNGNTLTAAQNAEVDAIGQQLKYTWTSSTIIRINMMLAIQPGKTPTMIHIRKIINPSCASFNATPALAGGAREAQSRKGKNNGILASWRLCVKNLD